MTTPLDGLTDDQLDEFERGLRGELSDEAIDQLATAFGLPQQGATSSTLSPEEHGDKLAAETSLYEFVRQAWHVVEPDVEFVDGWHIRAICDHLEASIEGRIPRLLINVPPACMKSLATSVFLPAWAWIHRPSLRFLYASYEQGLSTRDSVRTRQVIQSDWYQRRWGDRFKMLGDQNEKTRFDNDSRGWRIATSVSGRGTGEHPDVIVCFPAGTEITTDCGRVPIEAMESVGDNVRVLSRSAAGLCWSDKWRLTSRVNHRRLVKVRFASGRVIEATPDHPIWVQGSGYVQAALLQNGDNVLTDDHQALQTLSSAVRVEAKRQAAVLLPRMFPAVAAGQPKHQAVWSLRETSSSIAGASRKIGHCVLRARMPRGINQGPRASAIRWREAEVRTLRRNHPGWLGESSQDGALVFARMPPKISQTSQRAALACPVYALRRTDMDERDPRATTPQILFPPMRESVTSSANERRRKRSIQAWPIARGLSAGIPLRIPTSAEARRPLLPSLWSVQRSKRRLRHERSPHRLRCGEQRHGKFDQPLQGVPFIGPRRTGARSEVAKDTVVHVGIGSICERVYCLKVQGCRNYFANGVLVHNCDDPHNVKKSESDAEREAVIRWWDGTISSRGRTRGARRIVIMQRLHQEDLSGHIIRQDAGIGDWDHVCLPMRGEPDRMNPTRLGWRDPRGDAELLWPAVYDEQTTASLERDMGTLRAAGQLQQRPVPLGGNRFQRDWFEIVSQAPRGSHVRRVRYYDKAASEGSGAWTAGVLMSEADGVFYVEHVIRRQLSPFKRNRLMQQTAKLDARRFGNVVEIWTEQEPGSGGKESALITVKELAGYPVFIDRVTDPKGFRWEPLAAQAEAGNVKLVEGPWNHDFLDEIESVPNGKYKDQTDAAAGALAKLAGGDSGAIEDDLIASGGEDDEDRGPLTDADLEEMPDFLRELVEQSRESSRDGAMSAAFEDEW